MADTSDPLAIALDALEKARAATGRLYAEIGEVEALRAVAEIAERVANIQRTQLSMQIAAANTITIPQGLTPASRRAWLAAWMEADAAANRLPVIGAAEPTIKRPSVIREGDTIYHDEAGADAPAVRPVRAWTLVQIGAAWRAAMEARHPLAAIDGAEEMRGDWKAIETLLLHNPT